MTDKVGYFIQIIIVLLGVCLLVSGQVAGVVIIFPALLVDITLKAFGVKVSSGMSNVIKLLLLLQAAMVWIFMNMQSAATDLASRPLESPLIAAMMKPASVSLDDDANTLHNKDNKNASPHRLQHLNTREGMPVALHHNTSSDINSLYRSYESGIHPNHPSIYVHPLSRSLLVDLFHNGRLPPTSHHDLRYRTPAEVRAALAKVFQELPTTHNQLQSFVHTPANENSANISDVIPEANLGFDPRLRNPCWVYNAEINTNSIGPKPDVGLPSLPSDGDYITASNIPANKQALACLPYAYVLGQPKCGTSDLFERLRRHPQIRYYCNDNDIVCFIPA